MQWVPRFDKEPNGAVNTNDNTFNLNTRCLTAASNENSKTNETRFTFIERRNDVGDPWLVIDSYEMSSIEDKK